MIGSIGSDGLERMDKLRKIRRQKGGTMRKDRENGGRGPQKNV